jgi:hypothetical protein
MSIFPGKWRWAQGVTDSGAPCNVASSMQGLGDPGLGAAGGQWDDCSGKAEAPLITQRLWPVPIDPTERVFSQACAPGTELWDLKTPDAVMMHQGFIGAPHSDQSLARVACPCASALSLRVCLVLARLAVQGGKVARQRQAQRQWSKDWRSPPG